MPNDSMILLPPSTFHSDPTSEIWNRHYTPDRDGPTLGSVFAATFCGPLRGSNYNVTKDQPTIKRFVGIFSKDGKRFVAKVITHLDIIDWADMKGYEIERSFRMYGPINPEKERTEISDCSPFPSLR